MRRQAHRAASQPAAGYTVTPQLCLCHPLLCGGDGKSLAEMLQSFCTQAQSSTDEDVLYKRGGAAEKQLTKYDYTFLKE